MKVRTAAVIIAVVLAIGSTSFAVVRAGHQANDVCHSLQAQNDALYKIIDRSTQRLPQFVSDGTITQAQADQAYADNAESKADLVRPKC